MKSGVRTTGALITVGLLSSSLLVAGATGANAGGDNEELLKDARAAGIGNTVTSKSTVDMDAPVTSRELVGDPDYTVFDVHDDYGDGDSFPSIDVSALGVPVSDPELALAAAVTDYGTDKDMTIEGSAGLLLDLDGDADADLITITPPTAMTAGRAYASTFYKVVGDDYVDTGIPVAWIRDADGYVAGFEWKKLPQSNVSWVFGIVDEFGDADFAPNNFKRAVELQPVVKPPVVEKQRIAVKAKAVKRRSKIKVDVNPNKRSANYKIKIQKKAGGKWKTKKTTWTRGTKDKRTINMSKGKYRVKVPAQLGMKGTKSNVVFLKR